MKPAYHLIFLCSLLFIAINVSAQERNSKTNYSNRQNSQNIQKESDSRRYLRIWQVARDEHNKYRRRHRSPELYEHLELHDSAQAHADRLSKTNNLFHSDSTSGENIAWTDTVNNAEDAVREALRIWYSEGRHYNYNQPGPSCSTYSFTQVVWTATQHFGVGVAWNDKRRRWIIVAQYEPQGNIRGGYRNNVRQAY